MSRVKLDARRFGRTLESLLEALRADLGLQEGIVLKAELQSLLVYGPGQIFARHRDSERDDAMVATLVVALPSDCKGGAPVVEHQGETLAGTAQPPCGESWRIAGAGCTIASDA